MQRYFVTKKNKDLFSFDKEDEHHIKNVMRMELGEQMEIVYEQTLYHAQLTSMDPVLATLKEVVEVEETGPQVILAQSLVKEQKMDVILQKSTELGISAIIPLCADRSVVKLNEKELKKVNRWQKIVKEASEQSKRISIPIISSPLSIKELSHLDYDLKILCTVNELSKTLNKVLSQIENHDKILFVVGPEGGFTNEEERILIAAGFISTSLGSRVLRTETVSLYVMSVIQYLFMR